MASELRRVIGFWGGTTAGLGAIVWGERMRVNWTPLLGLGIAVLGLPVHALRRRISPGPAPEGASRA